MQLCFGTVTKILTESLNSSMQERTAKFVAGVVYCMEPTNPILRNYGAIDPKERLDNPQNILEFDGSAISRLRSCTRNLKFEEHPKVDALKSRLNSMIIPLISADKMASCILALFDLIRNDPSIDNEHKEAFRECLGLYKDELLQQEQLDVSDFFSGILLYTAHIKNLSGTGVSYFTKDNISKISKPYINEVSFDKSSGTVVLLFNKLFTVFTT